jgi:hypothetical protein
MEDMIGGPDLLGWSRRKYRYYKNQERLEYIRQNREALEKERDNHFMQPTG